jgi:hypothetical protein
MWRVDGLELFRATLTEFAFRPHAHEEFFIALTESGLATPRYRGDTHVIRPGDVMVLNPEEAHAGGPPPDGSWTYRALYPGPDLVRGLLAEFPGDRAGLPEFGGDVVRDPEVVARLRRFHLLSERPGADLLERQSELVAALTLLIGRHARAPRSARGSAPTTCAGCSGTRWACRRTRTRPRSGYGSRSPCSAPVYRSPRWPPGRASTTRRT